MESTSDVVSGIVAMLFVSMFVVAVVTRLLSGRFLVPKREIILPNQRGVIVQGDEVVRVADPGTCWLRPKQRVVLIDMRPKPLQMAGLEVLGSDQGVVRLSLSGEYKTVDPAVYYSNSANAADAIYVQLRRVLNVSARQQLGALLASTPEAFAARVLREMEEPAGRLGLALTQLDVYEAVPLGTLRVAEPPAFDFPGSGMVH